MTRIIGVERRPYQLVYLSVRRTTDPPAPFGDDVRNILIEARAFNRGVGIGGALLFNGTHFAQVLEGDRDAVLGLMNRILRDPRHSHVTLVEQGWVPERVFPHWVMAFADDTAHHRLPIPPEFAPERLATVCSRSAIISAMQYLLAGDQEPAEVR